MNLKISGFSSINLTASQWNIFFAVFILWLTWMYGSFDTLDCGPYSRHIWRQADCLAITKSYYNDGLPFLQPQVYIQYEGHDGKTISELPLVYYSIAQIWKLTGEHYWIYRLLSVTIFLIGLFYLKKLAYVILEDHFWSIFIAVFLYCSPLLAYYSNNYLMNTYALSLALIGTYHIYQYYLQKSYKHFVYACILFLIAGLLKITALLIFLAIGGTYLYNVIFRKTELKKVLRLAIPYLFVLLCMLGWQAYVHHYNSSSVLSVFLQGILPIWDIDNTEINFVWNKLWNDLLPEVYSLSVLCSLSLLLFILIVNYKKCNPAIFTVMMFIIGGICAYILLFFQVFDVHDYYLTNLLIVVPTILIASLDTVKRLYSHLFKSIRFKGIAIVVLFSMSYYAIVNTRIKYDATNDWVKDSFLISSEKLAFWEWSHWDYNRTLGDLETIEPLLDSVGCDYSTRVLSIPDNTINTSLVLMNRKGYTNYNYYSGAELIEKSKEWGAKFLIVNGLDELEKPYLQPYLENTVANTEFVTIIRL